MVTGDVPLPPPVIIDTGPGHQQGGRIQTQGEFKCNARDCVWRTVLCYTDVIGNLTNQVCTLIELSCTCLSNCACYFRTLIYCLYTLTASRHTQNSPLLYWLVFVAKLSNNKSKPNSFKILRTCQIVMDTFCCHDFFLLIIITCMYYFYYSICLLLTFN